MAWSKWNYKNNVIFRNHSAQSSHIINLTVNLVEDMRYYNFRSRVFGQHSSAGTHAYFRMRNNVKYRWRTPPDGWVKLMWMFQGGIG